MGTDPLIGVRVEELVRLTGVHLTTAKRWKRSRRIRRWLALLVQICVEGELEPIARPWRGWRIRGEHLISPEGWTFTFGEIRSIPFLHAQVSTYQQMQRTHLQADWIDERYVEADAGAGSAAA